MTATHAIQACRHAGLPVIDRESCTCGLRGRLVVLAREDGLRVVCPYDQPCPVHGLRTVTSLAVPDRARKLAEQLDNLFAQDVVLVKRLNAAQARLQAANDQLWWAAVQKVHWTVHKAFLDYQTAAEERRQLAADVGEVSRQFVDALVAAGWSEEQARNANVDEFATTDPANQRGN